MSARTPPHSDGSAARRPRVLVTGRAALGAPGLSAGEIREAVRAGRSGIGPVRGWDASSWPWKIAGEIPGFDPRAMVPDVLGNLRRFAEGRPVVDAVDRARGY